MADKKEKKSAEPIGISGELAKVVEKYCRAYEPINRVGRIWEAGGERDRNDSGKKDSADKNPFYGELESNSFDSTHLEKIVEDFGNRDQVVENIIRLYKDGDLEGLHVYMNERGESHIQKRFNQEVIYNRNLRMAKRIPNYIQQGNAFIAVGAGHLGGDDGLLDMLRNQGYIITRCSAND